MTVLGGRPVAASSRSPISKTHAILNKLIRAVRFYRYNGDVEALLSGQQRPFSREANQCRNGLTLFNDMSAPPHDGPQLNATTLFKTFCSFGFKPSHRIIQQPKASQTRNP